MQWVTRQETKPEILSWKQKSQKFKSREEERLIKSKIYNTRKKRGHNYKSPAAKWKQAK